jgi:hypothetical protein
LERSLCYGVLAISLVLSTTAHAPNSAIDISGTWQLNIAKSKPSKEANKFPILKPATLMIITSTADKIQMRYTTVIQQVPHETTKSYTPDGKEKILAQERGAEIGVTTRWKKGVLIIETSSRAYWPLQRWPHATEYFHNTQRWSLSTDGKTLTHDYARC